MSPGTLRVVTFEVLGPDAAVDAILRSAVVPRLLDDPDVADAWAGRRGVADGNHLLASTWLRSFDPAAAGAGGAGRAAPDVAALCGRDLEELGGVSIVSVEEVEIAIHARFPRPEPARVLRVFHGRTKAGELPDYIAEARAGMVADARVNDGLVSFVLGHLGGDDFITVSTWTGWAAIEAATGGDTRHPFATRNARRLDDYRIVHLELLPGAPVGRPSGAMGREGAREPRLEPAT